MRIKAQGINYTPRTVTPDQLQEVELTTDGKTYRAVKATQTQACEACAFHDNICPGTQLPCSEGEYLITTDGEALELYCGVIWKEVK